MALTFIISNQWNFERIPCIAYLKPNNWDDFEYKTLFNLTVVDEQGNQSEIGNVKIGFLGQKSGWTESSISIQFAQLNEGFFSLGQDADYYKKIEKNLSGKMAKNLLTALGDVVYNDNCLHRAENEDVFNTSLLRSVNRTSIEHQFKRILKGEAPLTDYNFLYKKSSNDRYSGIEVEFTVTPNTKPSSNIHVLIGRNGVGKTTLLNNMANALISNIDEDQDPGAFFNLRGKNLRNDYFAGVVSVSFSAFDPFKPLKNKYKPNYGMHYHYVGLKHNDPVTKNKSHIKNNNELANDFICSLKICFALVAKKNRWKNAIEKLESDSNFAEMNLCQLIHENDKEFKDENSIYTSAISLFSRMSSGHAIVLLTITKLVETVEEKTLLLLDEPESHLHPPLLSAFIRALSDLLVNRNAIAIIATHSPVVLQEVPKSCVSILRRTRLVANVDRPENETFAENVGILTREVFGLEVSKSGFHDLLVASVEEGKSYDKIEQEYNYQLGFEGKTILRTLITIRDSQSESNQ
jgi:predicted ATPase